MKLAPFDQKETNREEAKADCIKYGTPTLGVDHSNHYKKMPYETLKEADKEKSNGSD